MGKVLSEELSSTEIGIVVTEGDIKSDSYLYPWLTVTQPSLNRNGSLRAVWSEFALFVLPLLMIFGHISR